MISDTHSLLGDIHILKSSVQNILPIDAMHFTDLQWKLKSLRAIALDGCSQEFPMKRNFEI